MFEVVLHQPEIPPNTGNVIRLCANTGCRLHLIEPLGFQLDDSRLRRAGLDYHEYAGLEVHRDLSRCLQFLDTQTQYLDTQAPLPQKLDTQNPPRTDADARSWVSRLSARRLFAFSTRGRRRHDQVAWQPGDILLFGSETSGLPQALLDALPEDQRIRLPLRPHNRSLNLANAVAVAIYEAWRQQGFAGGS